MAQYIPQKVANRIITNFKNFPKILVQGKERDINESDTVQIVRSILSDIFGYDPFLDVTGEYSVRNTYCDLAIKIADKVKYLIEVKAIGIDLKESHLKQAADYASNAGIEWVILTNGIIWKLYEIHFEKPISYEEVFQIDFLNDNPKNKNCLEKVYVLCKEAMSKSAIVEFTEKIQLTDKYAIAALLQTEGIARLIKKQIRDISQNIKIEPDEIITIIKNDILKRDVIDSDKALQTYNRINKYLKKSAKKAIKIEVDKEITSPMNQKTVETNTDNLNKIN